MGLKEQPRHTGGDDGEHDGDERRQTPTRVGVHPDVLRLRGVERVAVGTDGHEERMGQRQLPGLPDQQVQPKGGNHRGEREDTHLQPEDVEVERRDQCHDDHGEEADGQ
jgi:hypothetical protein